ISTTSTSSMDPLGYWLLLVAFARLSSVYFGYFNLWALQVAVYSKRTMSDVHGRTFAVWTAVTCTLCILCALHLDSRPLYLATLASFLFALLHFLLELLVYKTMTLKNFAAPCFFACKCSLTILCVLHLAYSLYLTTTLAFFLFALLHFLFELLVYNTMMELGRFSSEEDV
ncbi:unnamed protein product, partial [Closterium sp. Naga37s-1]